MKSLISVIIPVYNQEKELKKALDSIEKQTYDNLEVVVVDDGSKLEFGVRSSEFRFSIVKFRQENKGAPAARNKGLEMSKGEYVIFWDADVVGEPEMLEKMYIVLQENLEDSYAYSDFYFGSKKIKAGEFNAERLKKLNYIHSTSLIRRKDVVKWDESLKRFQDWDLWLTMLEQGKRGVYVPEVLFKVQTGGTMSEWLPKFAYKKPWRWLPGIAGKVRKYEEAKEIVLKKHNLT